MRLRRSPQRQRGNALVGIGILLVLLFAITLMLLSLVEASRTAAPTPVQSEALTLLTTTILETNCAAAAKSLNKAIDEPGSSVPRPVMNNAYSLVDNCRAKQTLRREAAIPAPASPAVKTLVKHVLTPKVDRDNTSGDQDQHQVSP